MRTARLGGHLGAELAEKLSKPLIFQGPPAAPKSPPQGLAHGFDVTILVDVCKAILTADDEGKFGQRHKHMAKSLMVMIRSIVRSARSN